MEAKVCPKSWKITPKRAGKEREKDRQRNRRKVWQSAKHSPKKFDSTGDFPWSRALYSLHMWVHTPLPPYSARGFLYHNLMWTNTYLCRSLKEWCSSCKQLCITAGNHTAWRRQKSLRTRCFHIKRGEFCQPLPAISPWATPSSQSNGCTMSEPEVWACRGITQSITNTPLSVLEQSLQEKPRSKSNFSFFNHFMEQQNGLGWKGSQSPCNSTTLPRARTVSTRPGCLNMRKKKWLYVGLRY